MGSYKEAMAVGLLVLQQMIDDLGLGPRDEAAAPAKKPKGGTFGFGFGTKLS
ncbi:hypothetical protein [Variovorax sp. RKNM96]|uniref:hypothetical protein n=1 Tax=Variovorax sp. RKNM96 TaxID=2681552 RepID=UPI00198248BC|nr:hypothetical protein [Variovorax sp. RKNM96]